MLPDVGGAGEARGGLASGRLLEELRGIGRKCAFYNGFAGSVPKKSIGEDSYFFIHFLYMALNRAMHF